ncbi:MAG TPA: endonuclease/exonuclease/phosphatase family protein [Blastocatellia bacterium]|nr:endonuclease/exonuclease/phosphatase family protein [Blastocatellia bacterium]
MWARLILGFLFVASVAGSFYFDPARDRSLLAMRPSDGPRLRLMTWNIGYATLEDDSRAHTSDLGSVARTISRFDPDAVALQELTGPDQLQVLLGRLGSRYRGAVTTRGSSDRIEAILVKDRDARFEDIPSGDRYAMSATFRVAAGKPDVVLISAHADAFNAARRRAFTGDVVDWARQRLGKSVLFVAGDFNFDVNSQNRSNLFTDNLKHDSESYSYILKYFRDLGRDAGPTALGDRRIDYIFGQPEVSLFRKAEVLKGAAVGKMDHLPLFVEVVL